MVLASHVVFTTYGFWLPNDPRGSGSDFVRSWEVRQYGAATKLMTRHSVARSSHDRALRLAAKSALQYDPVRFTGVQALSVSRGFVRAISEGNYTVYACSILPEHVHLVLARHARPVEQIVGHLKAHATRQLSADGLHPFGHLRDDAGKTPPVWGRKAWKVFLDSADDIERSIRYVRNNTLKDGKKPQHWSFLTVYPSSGAGVPRTPESIF